MLSGVFITVLSHDLTKVDRLMIRIMYDIYSILTVNTSTCEIYMDRDTENLPVTSGHKSLPLNKFSHCKTIAKIQ